MVSRVSSLPKIHDLHAWMSGRSYLSFHIGSPVRCRVHQLAVSTSCQACTLCAPKFTSLLAQPHCSTAAASRALEDMPVSSSRVPVNAYDAGDVPLMHEALGVSPAMKLKLPGFQDEQGPVWPVARGCQSLTRIADAARSRVIRLQPAANTPYHCVPYGSDCHAIVEHEVGGSVSTVIRCLGVVASRSHQSKCRVADVIVSSIRCFADAQSAIQQQIAVQTTAVPPSVVLTGTYRAQI